MEVKPHQLLGAAVPQVGVLTRRDFVSFITSEFMEIKWIFIPTLGLSCLHGHMEPSQWVSGWREGDLCVLSVCSCPVWSQPSCSDRARLVRQLPRLLLALWFYAVSRTKSPIKRAAGEFREQEGQTATPEVTFGAPVCTFRS